MLQYFTLLLDSPVIIAAIFTIGIGGTFQYGFDVSVMTSASPFIKDMMNETFLQRYDVSLEEWQSSLIWSFTVSILCIGGLLGSLSASLLTAKYGRKRCLLFNNFFAILGSVLMILSQRALSFEMIMVGRFLYGINAGVSLSVHPVYLLECTPKRLRGMVGVTVATFTSFGKFCGQLLGIRELLGTLERWPWLLGFNGFTALVQLLTLPFLPESPKFLLLERGDRQACEKALNKLWGSKDHSAAVEEMLEEKASLQNIQNRSVMELIRDQTVRWQLLTIIVTFVTLQLCGINAVYFYSFDVLRAAGIQEDQLGHTALGTGLCEVMTSLACFMIVENAGKKALLFRGYAGMTVILIILTITLYLESLVSWMPYCSLALIFLFIFMFSGGPAGVTAPLPGELFMQSFKSAAYIIACTINWVGLFLVGMLFPIMVEKMDYFCFLVFLVFCAGCALFIWFNVPETKNQTVLEIAAAFKKMHGKSEEKSGKEHTEHKINIINLYETKF
ncbi:solute carrier family 2 member 11, like [Antennarius striatus]|uniref:solute carrier family 2 member 11, like n=1 Tax=Antennarius striatus TaxID=241820 RepID=UPI0035B108DB